MNKKFLILSGAGIIILFIFIVSLLFKSTGNNTKKPAMPTAPPTPYPTNNFSLQNSLPPGTGGREPAISEQLKLEANKKYDLMTKLPLDTSIFTLSYNYKEDKFVVSFKNPSPDNQSQFILWLKSNGYDVIPQSAFISQ